MKENGQSLAFMAEKWNERVSDLEERLKKLEEERRRIVDQSNFLLGQVEGQKSSVTDELEFLRRLIGENVNETESQLTTEAK